MNQECPLLSCYLISSIQLLIYTKALAIIMVCSDRPQSSSYSRMALVSEPIEPHLKRNSKTTVNRYNNMLNKNTYS